MTRSEVYAMCAKGREFTETLMKFDAINEKDMFSYRADNSRNAFEKWLFCDGSENEKIAFWNMFRESVNV